MCEACPGANRGGVDHQVVGIVIRDAGLGKRLSGRRPGMRAKKSLFVTPANARVRSDSRYLEALDSCFRRNDGWADHPASRRSRPCPDVAQHLSAVKTAKFSDTIRPLRSELSFLDLSYRLSHFDGADIWASF